ncbi:MAG: hypothetical protein ACI9YU_000573 [Flavobacteriales bacterium]|jgi:hypothetical protein
MEAASFYSIALSLREPQQPLDGIKDIADSLTLLAKLAG